MAPDLLHFVDKPAAQEQLSAAQEQLSAEQEQDNPVQEQDNPVQAPDLSSRLLAVRTANEMTQVPQTDRRTIQQ